MGIQSWGDRASISKTLLIVACGRLDVAVGISDCGHLGLQKLLIHAPSPRIREREKAAFGFL